MTWEQIETLHNEGHDIQVKSMNHKRLTEIPPQELESEIGKPYGDGKDDPAVISTIAKYYDLAITGFSDLMFLRCDGFS